MSCQQWTAGDLQAAMKAVQQEKVSLRVAAAIYGVPRSTLYDYVTGKVEIGSRRGPDSVLTAAEDAIHMAEIGYGRSREQIFEAVKSILDNDGRPNPFKNNMPGRKWWLLFKKRHPQISLCSPEPLQLCRIKCCTAEAICEWFTDFDQFLQVHDLKDKPSRIWNADEAGFPLCPKTGKVLAVRNARNVYCATGDSKEQITTLCAANAAGNVLPPMHIFSGERFKSNPMNDCVENAYFGRSPKGWMSTELFYGWVANHFARHVVERPVVLLVDGHSTHIDVEISKFCRNNGIHLYCLPPHTSHITQPLDVGFFSSLKNSWGKACEKFKTDNPGIPLNKYSFAKVFKCAWIDCVKLSMFVNAFRQSGICPFNPQAIDKVKLAPSAPFSIAPILSQPQNESSKTNILNSVEQLMNPETVKRYNTRFEEGYNVNSAGS